MKENPFPLTLHPLHACLVELVQLFFLLVFAVIYVCAVPAFTFTMLVIQIIIIGLLRVRRQSLYLPFWCP